MAAVAALVATAVLVACGGGGSSTSPPITLGGAITNSPVDGAPLKATCADGTAGGTGTATKDTFSISITCDSANYPVVIGVTGDGTMAGADMQFGTADDEFYKLAERAPLKLAIESNTVVHANLTAVSTLAAQPIEDKTAAYLAAPGTALKPTAADVTTAETNTQVALGLGTTAVKSANELTDGQIARTSAQLLQAVAVARAMGATSVSPEAVMKAFAQAAQHGGAAGAAGAMVKTEADGFKSFDIANTRVALTNASAFVTSTTLGATKPQMDAVNAVLGTVLPVEPAIKAKGTAAQQVAIVLAGVTSVANFDPTKANLDSVAADIRAALAQPTNVSGSVAAVLANVASVAMEQAIVKAQEINGNATMSAAEKSSRIQAVFYAAETVRAATEDDVLTRAAAAPLSADDIAREFAQVSIAVNVTGEALKTAAIASIYDAVANKPLPVVGGMAEKVREDVAAQLAGMSVSSLGDLKALVPATVLGSGLATANADAATILTALSGFTAPAGVSDAAVRAAVIAVVGSLDPATNLVTSQANVQTTISALATSLNGALTQSVSVGSASNAALSSLPPDVQMKVLSLAAQTVMGKTKFTFVTPPPVGSAGTAVSSAADTVSSTIGAKAAQTISFGTAPALSVGATATVTATSATPNSGNAITFSTSTPAVCTVSGSTVSALTAGSCVVAANQAGSVAYVAAARVTQNIAVAMGNQTITFGNVPTLALGGTATVTATGGASGNAITFSSTTPTVCTVAGSTVTALTSGSCIVAADQAGTANYNAAVQAKQTINVASQPQAIVFGAAPSLVVNGTGTVSATGGASGNAVTFSSTTAGVCTVAGSTVTGVSAGSCVVAANQAGNANYLAAPQATQTIAVGQASQVIGFGTAPTLVVGGTGQLVAVGGGSGLAVTMSSTTSSVCTISGTTISALTVGDCVISASQAGNANYSAAPTVTKTIAVNKSAQSISFGAAPTVVLNGTGTLSATGGASGNAVTFTSNTPSVCTVAGSTVSAINAGSCVIFANQAGNANYNAAGQVSQTITISPLAQVITFGTAPTLAYQGTGSVSATGGASGNAVTFSSSTTGVCTVSGSTVTAVSAGSCVITASQAGNNNYTAAASVNQTIPVAQLTQAITFGTAPTVVVKGTGTVSASGGATGNAVTFSTTSAACTVSGSTVTGVSAGNCVVTANQAGNTNYSAAPATTQTIVVAPGNQTIAFGTAPSLAFGGTATVSATASSGLSVNLASATPTVCSIAGTTVTSITLGTCTITATQAGNANYNAAPAVSQSITVGAASQSISFGAAPTLAVGVDATVTATATSGLAVTLTSTTPTVCTISGTTVTPLIGGTCTIQASQGGNANFSPANTITLDIGVGKANQSISFGTAPSLAVNGTGTVSATATSGLTVSLSSSTTGVCTISGTTVTALTAGTCTIAASQAGNTSFNAAPSVSQSITVGAASQTISFGAVPTLLLNGTATVTASSTSSLPVTFSSNTLSVCSVNGSTVTALTPGTCTVAANQGGNSNFSPAATITQNIQIAQLTQTISFSWSPSLSYLGTAAASATASSSLPVVLSSTTPSVCTFASGTVTAVAAGTCTIAANQAGSTSYAAAPQVTQSVTVTLGSQTITFGAAPTLGFGGTATVSATASSGLPVTFGTATSSVCTVSGTTVTAVTGGTCTITANQGGNSNVNAAPQKTQDITVTLGSQAIVFGTAPTVTPGGTGTLVISSSGASGNAVTFTTQTSSVCTVNSAGVVSGVIAGTCTIAANQAGNTNYAAAPQVTLSFGVGTPLSVATSPAAPFDGKANLGVNDAADGGAAYTGAAVQFGPYVISGATGAAAVTVPTNLGLQSYTTFSVNGGTAGTTGNASNGNTILVLFDLARYVTDAGGFLPYAQDLRPKIKVGSATVTLDVLMCGDPSLPPSVGNATCK